MNTVHNLQLMKGFLLVNVILFTIGVIKYSWTSHHHSPIVYPSSTRSLLHASQPKPCVCTYNVEDGVMKGGMEVREGGMEEGREGVRERSPEAPPPSHAPPHLAPPQPTPLRDKIGDDVMKGEEFQVPNIVHYIWFNTEPRPLQFHHMLSVLSAHKVLQPDVILFHTNTPPSGQYWEQLKALPTLKVVSREPPLEMFGEAVKEPMFYTSHSNVARIQILREYGGIYLDFDVLVVRPFTELRRHVCTIGYESSTKACGSIIVCSKHSFFLDLWINSYMDDYRMEEWAYNTGKVPWKLSKRFPYLVHIEEYKLNRPNFQELDLLWGPGTWNWRENYAVHTWYRLWKDRSPYYHGIEPNPDTIKTWNATFGEIARTILYGRAEIMSLDAK